MSLDSNWAEPKTNTPRDREAAELYLKTHVSTFILLIKILMSRHILFTT